MKFTIQVEPQVNPDAVGEHLRSVFFAKEAGAGNWNVGCYTIFDWADGVEPLPDIEFSDDPDNPECPIQFKWTCGRKEVASSDKEPAYIECRWYWDGDGVLVFIFPDDSCIVNSDCKKDHGWEHYTSWSGSGY